MEEKIRNFSECYFGYKMDIGKDELNLKQKEELWPRIYIEKKKNSDSQELFFTFPDWFSPVKTTDNTEKETTYNEIKIGFDPKGYLLDNIIKRIEHKVDNDMIITAPITINNKEIIEKGRYDLKSRYCSGVGYISLKKEDKETILYFAINYGKKKKIYYYIDKNKITFKTKNDLDFLKIKIYMNPDRIPCLKDESESKYEDYLVYFKNHVGKLTLNKEKATLLKKNSLYRFVDLGGDTDDEIKKNKQMYLLIKEDDKTNRKAKTTKRIINSETLCPYCHSPINVNEKDYQNGVFCDGKKIKKLAENFVLLDNNDKTYTKYILCKNNYTELSSKVLIQNDLPINPYRLLPDDILKKRNYRIAILGKARSGKTAYISRLLNISGNDTIVIEPEVNSLFEKFNIKSSSSNGITRSRNEIGKFTIQNTPYYSGKYANPLAKSFFGKYVISFKEKKFVKPTVEGSREKTTEFPFILNINDKAYVNIYDIAGEDAESATEELTTITKGENTSLIIVLDISKRIEVNKNILENASRAFKNNKETSPIAIVLSKFDQLEDEFNANCSCLRTDYNDLVTKNLDTSSLMKHIDASSEEIGSYLKSKGLNIAKFLPGFNYKFFSSSIITYSDAIFHRDNDNIENEQNGLNFIAGTKRVELPILWILHELGEI